MGISQDYALHLTYSSGSDADVLPIITDLMIGIDRRSDLKAPPRCVLDRVVNHIEELLESRRLRHLSCDAHRSGYVSRIGSPCSRTFQDSAAPSALVSSIVRHIYMLPSPRC